MTLKSSVILLTAVFGRQILPAFQKGFVKESPGESTMWHDTLALESTAT
jgi:hypothetical protein